MRWRVASLEGFDQATGKGMDCRSHSNALGLWRVDTPHGIRRRVARPTLAEQECPWKYRRENSILERILPFAWADENILTIPEQLVESTDRDDAIDESIAIRR